MPVGTMTSYGVKRRQPEQSKKPIDAAGKIALGVDGRLIDLIAELQGVRDQLQRSFRPGLETIKVKLVRSTQDEDFGKLVITVE